VEEKSFQILALMPYVARQSPVRQRYRWWALGSAATAYGATPSTAGLLFSVVAVSGDFVSNDGSFGSASTVGSTSSVVVVVLLGAHVAMCCLFAIGIYVQRRSWSDRLYVCYGKCFIWRRFLLHRI
jgi:hypothetical protein